MTDEEKMMDIWGHLDELRFRLMMAVIGLAVTTMASFALTPEYIKVLAIPVGGITKLQSIEVTENIGVFMRVSLLSGFIIAFPWILYQLLAYIIPGLTDSEKKWVYISIPFATVLFLAGVSFAFFIMMPAAIPFMLDFLGIPTVPRLANYIEFITGLLFWIGVCFEMPLLMFMLAKLKIITAGALFKQWRIALVVIAVLSAFITPTADPINMSILMAPLILLYLLSIFLAFIASGGMRKKTA